MHAGTCAALDKACVAHCSHVGPFCDLMLGSRCLVSVFVHFPLTQLVAAEAGFLALPSGIVRVVVSIIVVQLAAYGVANLHL